MIVGKKEEIRREATVPVQSRIDIRTLAEICKYFADGEAKISTASQLVSWSLEILAETLRRNDKIELDKPSIEAAYQYLESNGLMQKRMKRKKLTLARGFEELRMEGEDPMMYASGDYKSIHNNPNWPGKIPKMKLPIADEDEISPERKDMIDEAFRRADEEDAKKREEDIEKFKANCDIDENGIITPRGEPTGIVYEEDMKEYEERERKRKRLEDISKEKRRLEKRIEKKLDKIDSLKEKEGKDE